VLPDAGHKGKKAASPGDGSLDDVRFDWTAFYLAARKMGIAPSEFWDMTMPEFFAEIEGAAPKSTLTDDDRSKYTAWLKGE
jgi:hypothetical protein